MSHGGDAGDEDLSAMSAGIKEIVFVEVAWGHVGGQGGACQIRRSAPARSGASSGWFLAARCEPDKKPNDEQRKRRLKDLPFLHLLPPPLFQQVYDPPAAAASAVASLFLTMS